MYDEATHWAIMTEPLIGHSLTMLGHEPLIGLYDSTDRMIVLSAYSWVLSLASSADLAIVSEW